MEFLKYVQSLRTYFQTGSCRNFVLGNSGADYDSILGSIIYAFYMTSYLKALHLPLIDCPEKDMRLRFQVSFILDKYQIHRENLLYTQMIPNILDPKQNKMYNVLLYDDNYRKEIPHVKQIIDHHDIKNEINCPNVIMKCGSAMTLLYYLYNPVSVSKFSGSQLQAKFDKFIEQTKKNKQNMEYDPIINQLLYYGILLDSFNFASSQKGRWNQYDKNAHDQILAKNKPKLTIEEIQKQKTSPQKALQLTLDEHIRKDFKAITYGKYVLRYSTILLDPELFMYYYWHEVKAQDANYLDESNAYAFMFAYSDKEGALKRQIIFYSPNTNLMKIIENLLYKLEMKRLQDVQRWQRWEDPTSRISRKLFDKQLRQFMAKL